MAAFLGLRQRHLHDFLGDAHDLDVHLQRGNAVGGTRYLEVHVAQVIFVTQDVRQDGELAALFDQAHGDTGHVRFHRHAGVHQCQATAADRRHRRRTVRFGDFRHQAHSIAELFSGWQGGDQRALGRVRVRVVIVMQLFAANDDAPRHQIGRGGRRPGGSRAPGPSSAIP